MIKLYMCQLVIYESDYVEHRLYLGYSSTGRIVNIEEYNYLGIPDWFNSCIELPNLDITESQYRQLKEMM